MDNSSKEKNLPSSKMPVEISHKLELEPELPIEYQDVALKQGEDPKKIDLHMNDLRKLIYGKYSLSNYV